MRKGRLCIIGAILLMLAAVILCIVFVIRQFFIPDYSDFTAPVEEGRYEYRLEDLTTVDYGNENAVPGADSTGNDVSSRRVDLIISAGIPAYRL